MRRNPFLMCVAPFTCVCVCVKGPFLLPSAVQLQQALCARAWGIHSSPPAVRLDDTDRQPPEEKWLTRVGILHWAAGGHAAGEGHGGHAARGHHAHGRHSHRGRARHHGAHGGAAEAAHWPSQACRGHAGGSRGQACAQHRHMEVPQNASKHRDCAHAQTLPLSHTRINSQHTHTKGQLTSARRAANAWATGQRANLLLLHAQTCAPQQFKQVAHQCRCEGGAAGATEGEIRRGHTATLK